MKPIQTSDFIKVIHLLALSLIYSLTQSSTWVLGDIYLSRWWESAKKWGLLCNELKELDENLMNNQVTSVKTSINNVTMIDEVEYDEEDIEEIDDDEGARSFIYLSFYSLTDSFKLKT